MFVFLWWRIRNRLHKTMIGRICTIRQPVGHVIGVQIDLVRHFGSTPVNGLVMKRGAVQDIYVVKGAWHSKKKCQNRHERSAMAFKTTVAPSSFPLNIPFQEEGQFFHFQCMQSIEPKHPGHPLLEDSVSSCSRSSTAGRLKASLPCILSIALQKWL